MSVVVSGIRPTGHLHLGNYFGAVKNFVKLQTQEKCFFFIADYHALTTHTSNLQERSRNVLAEYLAAGLNPEKCTIYLQSDVSAVTELYLLLNMWAYVGELERCASFKDKIRKQPNNVNAGLLTYPVLMAADILLHKAAAVPVGKDQLPHLELARSFAERFNNRHKNNYFPLPQAMSTTGPLSKIMSLSGEGKMGKSENPKYTIFLNDSANEIAKKIQQTPTDSGPATLNSSKTPSVEALFQLLKVVSEENTYKELYNDYANCSIKYKNLKGQLIKDVISSVSEFQLRYKEYSKDQGYLKKVLRDGAEKAKYSARQTLAGVRQIIGLG